MKQISEPYKQIASKLLEKNPEDIDMTDSKYNDMLRFNDPKDNVMKGMTFGDAENHIRGLDEWNYTRALDNQLPFVLPASCGRPCGQWGQWGCIE